MTVILENGEVRCSSTLEFLGYYFIVDNVKYFVPNKKKNNQINFSGSIKTAP